MFLNYKIGGWNCLAEQDCGDMDSLNSSDFQDHNPILDAAYDDFREPFQGQKSILI